MKGRVTAVGRDGKTWLGREERAGEGKVAGVQGEDDCRGTANDARGAGRTQTLAVTGSHRQTALNLRGRGGEVAVVTAEWAEIRVKSRRADWGSGGGSRRG